MPNDTLPKGEKKNLEVLKMAARYITINKEDVNKTIQAISHKQTETKTFYNVSIKERKDGKVSIKEG